MTNVQQDGRVALITGVSGAIGAAVARLLASRGMRVVVNYYRSRDKADDVVASIRSGAGQAMAAPADVRDGPAVLGMLEQARAAMGEVEVLVHSAGQGFLRAARLDANFPFDNGFGSSSSRGRAWAAGFNWART